jgi:hypothetical protein
MIALQCVVRSVVSDWCCNSSRIHGIEREVGSEGCQWIRGGIAPLECVLLSALTDLYSSCMLLLLLLLLHRFDHLYLTTLLELTNRHCVVVVSVSQCVASLQGGDVLKFAGDAVIVMFGTESDTLVKATRRYRSTQTQPNPRNPFDIMSP